MNINNEYSAVDLTLHQLKQQGYAWTGMEYINNGRYCIINGNPNIAIIFKKEWYYKFGEEFHDLGEKGVGDSINCEDLRTMKARGVEIIYIKYIDGKLYYIPIDTFLLLSHRRTNKEGKETRSISIHHYKPYEVEQIVYVS